MLLLLLVFYKCVELIHLNEMEIKNITKEGKGHDELFIFDWDHTLCMYKNSSIEKYKKIVNSFLTRNPLNGQIISIKEIEKKFNLSHYGLRMRGFNNDIVKKEVFDEYSKIIIPEMKVELRRIIQNIKGDKWIFTNNYVEYVEKCLESFGFENHFQYIFGPDYSSQMIILKPFKGGYNMLNTKILERKYKKIYFFDDSERNIKMGEYFDWECFFCNYKSIIDKLSPFEDK